MSIIYSRRVALRKFQGGGTAPDVNWVTEAAPGYTTTSAADDWSVVGHPGTMREAVALDGGSREALTSDGAAVSAVNSDGSRTWLYGSNGDEAAIDPQRAKIMRIQEFNGVPRTGVWDKATMTSLKSVKERQKALGVKADGIWGPKSRIAFADRKKERATASDALSSMDSIVKKEASDLLKAEDMVLAANPANYNPL